MTLTLFQSEPDGTREELLYATTVRFVNTDIRLSLSSISAETFNKSALSVYCHEQGYSAEPPSSRSGRVPTAVGTLPRAGKRGARKLCFGAVQPLFARYRQSDSLEVKDVLLVNCRRAKSQEIFEVLFPENRYAICETPRHSPHLSVYPEVTVDLLITTINSDIPLQATTHQLINLVPSELNESIRSSLPANDFDEVD